MFQTAVLGYDCLPFILMHRTNNQSILPVAVILTGLFLEDGRAENSNRLTPATPSWHRVAGNLIKNSSFEHNWFNRKFTMNRRFLLLHGSDMGVGEEDGHIDHWQFQGIPIPDAWDMEISRSGGRSVRFDRPGSGSQLVRFAGEQFWNAGGAYYASFLPMVDSLAGQLHRRQIVVGAWCRTKDVLEGAEPQLIVTIDSAMRKDYDTQAPMNQSKAVAQTGFSAGTHDWEYREVRIVPKSFKPPKAGEANLDDLEKKKDDLDTGDDVTAEEKFVEYEGAPYWVTVQVVNHGGTVWFDDVSCAEDAKGTSDRMPDGGFEEVEKDWPKGWSRPQQWGWFRNTYYAFTGWSHWKSQEPRGSAVLDETPAFQGERSLRFNVFPGDNFAVHSDPIELNQTAACPLEVRAMVKADNLRTLEIMAQDERGQWLPQGDFLGDDMEEPGHYNFGTTGSGTYDWSCVRKYFSPRSPVKTVSVFLCARGFDGAIVEKNLVGTVWFDEVQVFEHGVTRKLKPSFPEPKAQSPHTLPLIVDIDLGDRLWGRNVVKVMLEYEGHEATKWIEKLRLEVRLTSPSGKTTAASRSAVRILEEPGARNTKGYAILSAEYEVNELCKSWKEQYELFVQVVPPAESKAYPGRRFHFGTPSQLVSTGVSAYYLYPDEQLTLYANLNISRGSIEDIALCEVAISNGGGVKKTIKVDDLSAILKPQRSAGNINAHHLLQVKLDSKDLTVHPWQEPVLDCLATIRLYSKMGNESRPSLRLTAEGAPVRFGFMEKVPKPSFPETIKKTAINERGFITINGQPYFPVYWTPHFGIVPEVNYPPMQFGYKSLNLMKLVCSKEAAPDDEVKAELLKKINEVKNDPKFFQYEIGEGEMQLQGGGWQQRVEWCKKAIGWIREADPDHVINGPISWLVGHPHHNSAMKQFVSHWDVIGVEASFEYQPKVNEFALPLMKARRTAVLVGLETYFYQSNRTLRWRGYRSLLNGATGIGLCPSGMMQSRPDKENYLRGLNGEFRGLGPILTSDEPVKHTSVSSNTVEIMERVHQGKRFLFAVGDQGAGAQPVRFTFPEGVTFHHVRVLFEARSIQPAEGGFEDDFGQAQTVHVYELLQ